MPIGPTADDPRRDHWPQHQWEAALGASSHRLSLRYSVSINVSLPLSTGRHLRDALQPVEAACDDVDRHDRELARLDSASGSLVMRSSGPCRSRSCTAAFWRERDRASELNLFADLVIAPSCRGRGAELSQAAWGRRNRRALRRQSLEPPSCRCRQRAWRGHRSGTSPRAAAGQHPSKRGHARGRGARVVPDEHDRTDGLGKNVEPLEQFPLRGGVELRDELDGGPLAERRLDRLERLASAKRGGAEHESGTDPLPAQVLGDAPRRAFASRRERAVDVRKGRIRPARLPVPKQDDPSHSLTVPAGRVDVK